MGIVRSGLMAAALSWSAVAPAQSVDEAAIRSAVAAQEAAFNAHDAHALAQSYSEDADIVIPFGWRWRGRAEIERKYGEAFTYLLAKAQIHADPIEVRALAPGLALAHIYWTDTGIRAADGSDGNGTDHGIESQILKNIGGRWLVISSQETSVTPEQPMPVKAPALARAKPEKPVDTNRKCFLARGNGDCLIYR